MEAVIKATLHIYEEEILEPPTGCRISLWMRAWAGRFRDFKISNYQLMMKLIDACKDTVLKQFGNGRRCERVSLYHEHNEMAKVQIAKCSTCTTTVVLD